MGCRPARCDRCDGALYGVPVRRSERAQETAQAEAGAAAGPDDRLIGPNTRKELKMKPPPIDNEHVAPGAIRFTPEEIALNRKKDGPSFGPLRQMQHIITTHHTSAELGGKNVHSGQVSW